MALYLTSSPSTILTEKTWACATCSTSSIKIRCRYKISVEDVRLCSMTFPSVNNKRNMNYYPFLQCNRGSYWLKSWQYGPVLSHADIIWPIQVTWLVLAKLIMFVMKMCHKHANIWMEKDSGFIECRAISVNLYRIQVSVTIQTLKKELPASEFPEEVANCFALCSWLNLAESSFCRVLTFDKPGTTRGFWKKEFHKYTN